MNDQNLQYLTFFYNNLHKIKSNLNLDINDKRLRNSFISIYSPYELPLEQARLQVISHCKNNQMYPKDLLSYADCSCFSKGIKNFWLLITKNVQCTRKMNGFNPFSFHFINFDLKDKHMKIIYEQTMQNFCLNFDLDSKFLLLNLACLVCKNEKSKYSRFSALKSLKNMLIDSGKLYKVFRKCWLGRLVIRGLFLYDNPCECEVCNELEKWEA